LSEGPLVRNVVVQMTSVRGKTVFHNTTPDLQDQDRDHSMQDQDQDQDLFLVSDRSCPKTDGLRPHHWSKIVYFAYYCILCNTQFQMAYFVSYSLSHFDLTTPTSEVGLRYLENWMSDVSILSLVSTSVFFVRSYSQYTILKFWLLVTCRSWVRVNQSLIMWWSLGYVKLLMSFTFVQSKIHMPAYFRTVAEPTTRFCRNGKIPIS